MIEIKYNNIGFMKDAAYENYFSDIANKYESGFEGLEKVIVEINEDTPYDLRQQLNGNLKEYYWFVLNEDKTELIIKFSQHRSYDSNGKEIGIPTPQSVFLAMHTQMKIAVERYSKIVNE